MLAVAHLVRRGGSVFLTPTSSTGSLPVDGRRAFLRPSRPDCLPEEVVGKSATCLAYVGLIANTHEASGSVSIYNMLLTTRGVHGAVVAARCELISLRSPTCRSTESATPLAGTQRGASASAPRASATRGPFATRRHVIQLWNSDATFQVQAMWTGGYLSVPGVAPSQARRTVDDVE